MKAQNTLINLGLNCSLLLISTSSSSTLIPMALVVRRVARTAGLVVCTNNFGAISTKSLLSKQTDTMDWIGSSRKDPVQKYLILTLLAASFVYNIAIISLSKIFQMGVFKLFLFFWWMICGAFKRFWYFTTYHFRRLDRI